jgi:hypothetical protein
VETASKAPAASTIAAKAVSLLIAFTSCLVL